MESEGLLKTRTQSYDSLSLRCASDDSASGAAEGSLARSPALGSRVRTALVLVSLSLLLFMGAVSTTSTQRASLLSKLPVLNFKKTTATHAGELANTPPPSPSVIKYTYKPTAAPSEERSESLPSKKQSANPRELESARGGKFTVHDNEEGNTPPPSPSVIKYTYQPTKSPVEETSEESEDGTDVSFEATGKETETETVEVTTNDKSDKSDSKSDKSSSKTTKSSSKSDRSESKPLQ